MAQVVKPTEATAKSKQWIHPIQMPIVFLVQKIV